jgi:uncharacterized protein
MGGKPMTLQERLKVDLAAAMKAKDEEKKSILRVILGEMSRQSQKRVDDAETIKIIKKLVKSEKEVLAQRGAGETDRFIEVAESYLPQQAGEAEIRAWIDVNIDFSAYKNKMQAMGPIMKHFGDSADGETVKRILQQLT